MVGEPPEPWARDFPTVRDGGLDAHFIYTALESSDQAAWVDAWHIPPGS